MCTSKVQLTYFEWLPIHKILKKSYYCLICSETFSFLLINNRNSQMLLFCSDTSLLLIVLYSIFSLPGKSYNFSHNMNNARESIFNSNCYDINPMGNVKTPIGLCSVSLLQFVISFSLQYFFPLRFSKFWADYLANKYWF